MAYARSASGPAAFSLGWGGRRGRLGEDRGGGEEGEGQYRGQDRC